MRLEELTLERYGRFRDTRLDFTDSDIRLHVLYGPNEAGKSTALAAICDLLFGFEQRTRYAFLHGYEALAVGATLSNRQGDTLAFRRRKGLRNTLLSAESGLALPDNALIPFLGALTRETFERQFGLNHQRLREGGDQMLRDDGDLGRTLLQAASGLSSVRVVLDALRADADMIGSPQRKSAGKPLWRALGDYDEAQQRTRRDALREADWSEAVDTESRCAATLAAAREALDRQRARHNRIKRLLAVLPVLTRLDSLTAQLETLADTPDLPTDFAESWRKALSAEAEAATMVRRLDEDRAVLAAQMADMPPPGPLPDHGERIERLYRDSGNIATLRNDRPKLERDLQHSDGRLHEFLVRLGGCVAAATVEAQRPPHPRIARIRERIAAHGGLEVARRTAEGQQELALGRLAETEAALKAIGSPVDPTPAVTAWNEALAAGDIEERQAKAEQAQARHQTLAAALLARLTRWSGPLEALTIAAFPEIEQVQSFAARFQALDASRKSTSEAYERAADTLLQTTADLAALQAEGEVPTPEALRCARDHRQRGWSLIRAGYIERTLTPAAAAAGFDGLEDDLPARYEAAVRHADDLVDRREREAQRIERYRLLQRQSTDAEAQTKRLSARRAEIDRHLETERQAWLALWQPTGITPGNTSEMAAWLQRKDEVVRAAEAVVTSRLETETVRRQTEAVRNHLRRVEAALGQTTDPDDHPTLAVLRNRVRAAVDQAKSAWDGQQRLKRERTKVQRELERTQAALTAAVGDLERWTRDWAAEMPVLGLPASATPPEAGAALDVWAEIDKELTDRRQRQERLRGIVADLDRHENETQSLVAILGTAIPDDERTLPPLDLPPLLYRRWKASQEIEARRASLAARLDKLDNSLCNARRRHDEARRTLEHLRHTHQLADSAEPLVEAARAEERGRLRTRLAEARNDLAAIGEGRSEAELRTETLDANPDDLKTQAQAIDDDEQHRLKHYDDARDAATLARQQFDTLRARTGIGAAAEAAKDAALEAAELARRWTRLTVAHQLLSKAIERFRTDNEHPLLRRASTLFALIARTADNPFERLTVDYGKGDRQVLIGVRRDDTRVTVDGMSDGTRDQLYLALRIAAIEATASGGEAMPFIADDLFITSDDQRTAPGLQALAELGAHTQVLLFTHHRHVVDLARSLIPASTIRFHTLGSL